MLIRIEDDTLHECPDDLAALILASPGPGRDLHPFSVEEVNALIHWTLGGFSADNLTWEENLKNVRDAYEALIKPSPSKLDAALLLIRNYNENIKLAEVGLVDRNLLYPPAEIDHKIIDYFPQQQLLPSKAE